MNILLHWLTAPEWALVVKALLHSLWQGALIAMGLALLLRQVSSPMMRYRLTLGGLTTVVASAIITWAVLNAPKAATSKFVTAPPRMTEPVPTLSGPVQRVVVVAERKPAQLQLQWTAWLALAWLLGASVMLGRASVKVAGAEQLRRSCQPLNDPRINELVAEARRAVQLTRQVRIAVTNQITSPAVVGVLVPTLILPLSLITTLTPEQLRFILLHELAHIRRGDYLANLFQLFAEALFFFNPAVWWLSHQIRREREACCDALAIELSGAPADYARTLVSVAETMLTPSPTAAPAFGNESEPSRLSDRVQRALVPGYRPSLRLTWRAMLAALVTGGLLLGLLAAGTRETVAATAALLEPKAAATDSAKELSSPVPKPAAAINPATGLPDGGATRINPATGLPEAGGVAIPESPGTKVIASGVSISSESAIYSASEKALTARGNVEIAAANGMKITTEEARIQLGTNSAAIGANTNLFTRTFKVDPNSFVTSLEIFSGSKQTNHQERIREFLTSIGANLQPPKAVFFNDRQGGLFVRATLAELDIIEQAVQVLAAQAPQVHIRARFVEVPAGKDGVLLGSLGLASSNSISAAGPGGQVSQASIGLMGILTATQAGVIFRTLEQAEGVVVLAMPSVTTLSGRQAQIQLVDIRTVVTGAASLITNGVTTNVFQTSALPFGPVLDVIPHVSADGYTVQMTIIPTVTEFLGYDRPEAVLTEYARTNVLSTALPLPRFRVRQLTTSAMVWDGQTIVLGGFVSETVTRQPDGSEIRRPDAQPAKKQLLVFITPTIIDAAGNRVHHDEDKLRDRPDAPTKLPEDWK